MSSILHSRAFNLSFIVVSLEYLFLCITSCFLARFVPTEGFSSLRHREELCYNDWVQSVIRLLWASILSLPLTWCEALNKSLKFSESHFITCIIAWHIGWVGGFNDIILFLTHNRSFILISTFINYFISLIFRDKHLPKNGSCLFNKGRIYFLTTFPPNLSFKHLLAFCQWGLIGKIILLSKNRN